MPQVDLPTGHCPARQEEGSAELWIWRDRIRSLIIIMMEHLSYSNKPKLVQHCNYPLTAQRGVDLVVTDIGLFRWIDGSFWLQAIAPGFSVEEVLALTEMDVEVSPTVDSMTANE